jgi:RNA polymerase sigma-70 factor, ECF subfamily
MGVAMHTWGPTQARHPAELWLEAHGDALWRYALARVPSAAAEDLVQECLLAAIRVAPSFDGRSSRETWLIGILRHKIADYYRARAREPRPDAGSAAPTPFTDAGMWSGPAPSWDVTSDHELRSALESCRERLPPGLRDALELRDLRQLPADAVCEVLGISRANLWTRLHRARLFLRGCITARLDRSSAKTPS